MDSTIIERYFPELTERQKEQFEKMGPLYAEWNSKINVVSRKDIDNLYVNHVLHSLSIAKFLGSLPSGITFLDMGTGGGFPGIPLAVFYPQSKFHLIDRIGKKIRVAQEISKEIGLNNVSFQHGDIGECRERYNYVVSRAVMPLNALIPLIKKNVKKESSLSEQKWANGLICLKGGDMTEEKKGISYPIYDEAVNVFFAEPHFEEKFIVYVPIK